MCPTPFLYNGPRAYTAQQSETALTMTVYPISEADRITVVHRIWLDLRRSLVHGLGRHAMTGLLSGLLIAAASADAAAPKVLNFAIENGAVVGNGDTVRVQQGDDLELRWSSDKAMELHLHGYDIEMRVSPQSPAVMSFKANIPGRFPVEAHGLATAHPRPLLYLE